MQYFAVIGILLLTACINNVTAPEADARSDTFSLVLVDQDSLPAPTDHANRSLWVVSGSLTLQPDGHYLLTERDSVWNGHTFAPEDRKEGGIWVADGSLLTLTDTATQVLDTYGAGSPAYFGSIATHTVVLTIPTDDGTGTDIYRYQRDE